MSEGIPLRLAIVGAGAAGMFAAVNAAIHARKPVQIEVFERGVDPLRKVRISGGGRCNVTHACFDPVQLAKHYPRGSRELRAAFRRFQPRDTMEWFTSRGVALKIERDGRVFPVCDQSSAIIDCLLGEAARRNVSLRLKHGVERIHPLKSGWELCGKGGWSERFDRVLIATGGPQVVSQWPDLRHSWKTPVPSLFTFHVPDGHWIRTLPGTTLPDVLLSGPGRKIQSSGPLLITHWGISGPAALRLSAFGAREWSDLQYHLTLEVNWLPEWTDDQLRKWLQGQRKTAPAKLVRNSSPDLLPQRFWESFLSQPGGISPSTNWSQLSREQIHWMVETLRRGELPVAGKSMNKEEFVTCGGVDLREVDFSTMQSRLHPGLHFAGEVLDVDGVTGGFNFQAAWTTGWIAAEAMIHSNS